MPKGTTLGSFVIQSFRAESLTTNVNTCTNSLPNSSSFVGQGGGLQSASFNRLPISTEMYSGGSSGGLRYLIESGIISGNSTSDSFIECDSVSIQYSNMGIITISYNVVSNTPKDETDVPTPSGFNGYIYNLSCKQIPNTDWYSTSVTMVTEK